MPSTAGYSGTPLARKLGIQASARVLLIDPPADYAALLVPMPEATVWVSWPKKASKVPSMVTEDTIRELALPLGFVDINVRAVSEVWSGLKLVVRKELRRQAQAAA